MTDLATISGNVSEWSDSQKALMEFAGLVKKVGDKLVPAPRPIIEAFAQTVARTQLDPIARQIYCIERGGKYTISVGIDGARLVAQRTGEYAGQKPIEWTADGKEWVEVWLDTEPPKAARCGVMRQGFTEPLYAVATWSGYAPYFSGRLSPMWNQHGPLMLGKCAEMLALRKAFPMELSGIYLPEEMDSASSGPVAPSRDWLVEAKKLDDKADLAKLFAEAKEAGELTSALSAEFMNLAGQMTKDSREQIVEAEVVEEQNVSTTKA